MNLNKLEELKECDLYETQGGIEPVTTIIISILGVAASAVCAGVGAYQIAKSDAYDAGKAKAYQDMYGTQGAYNH